MLIKSVVENQKVVWLCFIKCGSIAPYLPEAHQQHKVVMQALAKATKAYAKGNYFVIVDGIIGPWFLKPFKTLDVLLHYIVLRPPLEVSIQRCETRAGGTLTNSKAIAELHRQLSSPGPYEKHVLECGQSTASEVMHNVITAVQSGKFRL